MLNDTVLLKIPFILAFELQTKITTTACYYLNNTLGNQILNSIFQIFRDQVSFLNMS